MNAVDSIKGSKSLKASKSLTSILALLFLLMPLSGLANEDDPILCGMAIGYPPFQYLEQNKYSGIDVDVIKLIAKRGNLNLSIKHGHWDDIVSLLRFSELDCVIGMEINELRLKYFDFSYPYYNRYTAIFVKADRTDLTEVNDLYGQIISGDRHSLIENNWTNQRVRDSFRIMQTDSKRESMNLLNKDLIAAAIMPRSVGYYLAKDIGIRVKIIELSEQGAPVGISVKKGNSELLNALNRNLHQLIKEGEIDKLFSTYQRDLTYLEPEN
ncbi:transporter substrate-binding domain-containing protein [Neptuniibacter sp. QD48_11]|uniref:transporter substrate-binding domain-containing protein n=1 Tax=unclassified Neptuniibacter TaxID=2630693 RepID=UPI0039F48FCB